jgi:hypothetical protein
MIDWKGISLENLAGLISEELRKDGIEIILVGGACVTIYSKNNYQSYDLDFVTYEDLSKVAKALKRLKFESTSGYFRHANCPWIVEFLSPPISVGDEAITQFSKVTTKMGQIRMLRPTDCVKDRLASFFHWNDRQGLDQAISVCVEEDIDLNELQVWAKEEEHLEKFEYFLNQLRSEGNADSSR